MKKTIRLLAMALAIIIGLGLSVPAFAGGEPWEPDEPERKEANGAGLVVLSFLPVLGPILYLLASGKNLSTEEFTSMLLLSFLPIIGPLVILASQA